MASLDKKIQRNLKKIEKRQKKIKKHDEELALLSSEDSDWAVRDEGSELTLRQYERGLRKREAKRSDAQIRFKRAQKKLLKSLKRKAKLEWREARVFNKMINQKLDYLDGLFESKLKSDQVHDYQNPDNITRAVFYLMNADDDVFRDVNVNPNILMKRLMSLQDQNITDVSFEFELDEDHQPDLKKLVASVEKHEKDLSDSYTALLLIDPVAVSHQAMSEVYTDLSEVYKQRSTLVQIVAYHYGPFIDRYRKAFIMGNVFADNREMEPDFSMSDDHYVAAAKAFDYAREVRFQKEVSLKVPPEVKKPKKVTQRKVGNINEALSFYESLLEDRSEPQQGRKTSEIQKDFKSLELLYDNGVRFVPFEKNKNNYVNMDKLESFIRKESKIVREITKKKAQKEAQEKACESTRKREQRDRLFVGEGQIAVCFEKPSRRIAFLADDEMDKIDAKNRFLRTSPTRYKESLWAACRKIVAQTKKQKAPSRKNGLPVLRSRMPKELKPTL